MKALRIEYGNDLATIQDCSSGSSVQLNLKTKTFLPMATEPTPPPASSAKTKGGRITYTTTVVDTGETKAVFGMPARRMKTTVTKEVSADACDKKPERVETDGWYIEAPAALTCMTPPQPAAKVQIDPQHPDCRDDVRYVTDAKAPVGYPVSYTMAASKGDEKPSSTTMEVSELKRSDLDPSRFQPPPDYIEVKTVAQLTADHRAPARSARRWPARCAWGWRLW